MKPDPVQRHSVSAYEESTEQKEVGQDRHHHRESQHHVRDYPRQERDEGASRPEGSEDDEEVEKEAGGATGETHRKESGGGEC